MIKKLILIISQSIVIIFSLVLIVISIYSYHTSYPQYAGNAIEHLNDNSIILTYPERPGVTFPREIAPHTTRSYMHNAIYCQWKDSNIIENDISTHICNEISKEIKSNNPSITIVDDFHFKRNICISYKSRQVTVECKIMFKTGTILKFILVYINEVGMAIVSIVTSIMVMCILTKKLNEKSRPIHFIYVIDSIIQCISIGILIIYTCIVRFKYTDYYSSLYDFFVIYISILIQGLCILMYDIVNMSTQLLQCIRKEKRRRIITFIVHCIYAFIILIFAIILIKSQTPYILNDSHHTDIADNRMAITLKVCVIFTCISAFVIPLTLSVVRISNAWINSIAT